MVSNEKPVMLYTSKRFLYNLIVEGTFSENGCYAVVGARNIGKTILFLQLNEYFGDKSDYVIFEGVKEFDFVDYFNLAIFSGKEYIFFDEICKLDEDLVGDFISWAKYYSCKRNGFFVVYSLTAQSGCSFLFLCL